MASTFCITLHLRHPNNPSPRRKRNLAARKYLFRSFYRRNELLNEKYREKRKNRENSYVLHLKLESLQGHASGDSSLLSTQWRTPSHTRSGDVSFKYSEQVHSSGSSDPSKQSLLRSQNALRSTHFPFLHRSSILVQSSNY